jgi:hypothetical protein
MNVDREVIRDLLPLYQAGLASSPTRRLVEDWLRDHHSGSTLTATPHQPPSAESELAALLRAKRLLRRQRWLFGSAIGLTALGGSLELRRGHGIVPTVHLLAFEYPLAFLPLLAGAALLWLLYFRLKRRLRQS